MRVFIVSLFYSLHVSLESIRLFIIVELAAACIYTLMVIDCFLLSKSNKYVFCFTLSVTQLETLLRKKKIEFEYIFN